MLIGLLVVPFFPFSLWWAGSWGEGPLYLRTCRAEAPPTGAPPAAARGESARQGQDWPLRFPRRRLRGCLVLLWPFGSGLDVGPLADGLLGPEAQ